MRLEVGRARTVGRCRHVATRPQLYARARAHRPGDNNSHVCAAVVSNRRDSDTRARVSERACSPLPM